VPSPGEFRPTWRGWLHTVTFLAAVPGGILLILGADRASGKVGASVYFASLLLGFGTSAAYHRLARRDRAVRIMQRMDHSMIFVLIAGTYTPICLLGMSRSWGIAMLCGVWGVALFGILIKQFAFERFRILEYAMYPLLGWGAVIATPTLLATMSVVELVLVALGGVLYTVGIPFLIRERPNPWPKHFGYHEIWHTFTVAAGACHFAAIALLLS